MEQVLIFLHVLICITLICLVLLQRGIGAGAGAGFGGGSSNTFFGSAGPTSFLMRFTGILAIGFFATSLTLGYIASRQARKNNPLLTHTSATAPVSSQSKPTSLPTSTKSEPILPVKHSDSAYPLKTGK